MGGGRRGGGGGGGGSPCTLPSCVFPSPSSLLFVDLRLCYPIGSITRLQYEYDTSFFNGYYKKTTPTGSKVHESKEKYRAEVSVGLDTVPQVGVHIEGFHCIEVSSLQGVHIEGSHCIEVSAFQGVHIEGSTV